jgi:hypothetical protein
MTSRRVFRGVYDCVLQAKDLEEMKALAESQQYGRGTPKDGLVDVQIKSTPLVSRNCQGAVDSFIRSIIEENGMDKIFQVLPPSKVLSPSTDSIDVSPSGRTEEKSVECIDAFILKYEGNGKKYDCVLTPHRDGGEEDSVVSIVYTIGEDCAGGTVNISDRNDGEMFPHTGNRKDIYPYSPQHNSVYAFNGNYATHQVMNIQDGIRYAFVAFLRTSQTEEDVIRLWCKIEGKELCLKCGNSFIKRKTLTEHSKKCSKQKCIHCGLILRGTQAEDNLVLHLNTCGKPICCKRKRK